MELVLRSDWFYSLYRSEKDEYFIAVVCGSVGIYEVNVKLNDEQCRAYSKRGKEFIEELAAEIRNRPWGYPNINIDV